MKYYLYYPSLNFVIITHKQPLNQESEISELVFNTLKSNIPNLHIQDISHVKFYV